MSNETPTLISYRDVCRMLSIGKNAFFTMRQSGRFPIQPIRGRRAKPET